MRPSDQALREALAAHRGVVGRGHLLAAGLSSSAIARRIEAGELRVVVPGVYRPATTVLTPDLRLRAIALRLPEAVVAGRWAAWWHDLAGPTRESVMVVVPPDGSQPRWPDLTVLRRPLAAADRMTVRGLRVTTRARTVLDCAGRDDAEAIRDRALQRGTTILSLQTTLDRMSPGNGSAAARRLVQPARKGGVSPPERTLRRSLTRPPGSRWRCGIRVIASGRECTVDLGIEEIRLAVETGGWTVHSQGDAFHEDRERQNALALVDWTVLRYTPRRLHDDLAGVIAEIRLMEAKLSAARRR